MGVQLYARTINKGQYQLLDLFSNEPIKLTLSVANIVDPLAANSVFSRTFRVPHTSINGPFFEAVFNVNSTDFDASKKAEAYINDNGHFFASGNIRLTNIYVNEESNNVEYEINFYGETSDFGSKIGGGFLSQIDLTQYDHSQTYNNIVNSWNYGLFGGDIVYPLVEWGYNYSNGLPINSTLAYGGTNGFTSPSHPLNINQFKPAIRAKALWDAIFEETDYTYTSTFLNSALFRNLYVIAENEARATVTADLKFQAEATSAVTYLCGTQTQVIAGQEINDPSNSYNAQTSTYTAKAAGTYNFNIECVTHGSFVSASATAAIWRIEDAVTGTVLGTSGSPTTILGGTNFSFVQESILATLAVGQTVKLTIDVFSTGNPADSVDVFGNAFFIDIAPSLVTMTSFMPNNIRKIDFMRSIINRFRLVFIPNKDNQNEFEIIPWRDWILSGTEKDWTLKLDGSKDMKISPLFYSQERLQVYKDQEDADFINYNYQLDYKQTYGQRNLDSNNELIKGTKTIQDQFAPLPLWPIGNADYDGTNSEKAAYKFLIPHLAKDTDKERQPIQPKLRLAFYNTNQPVPEVTSGQPLAWYLWNGAAPIQQTSYPLMSQYSTWPVTNTTYDLSWENEPPLYNTENSGLATNRTPFDTFTTYWKTWYDTNFDPYSRIVEANFVLDYQDIFDLKFNDYIFVKDAWYFVNKVTDYIAGEDTNCRVELIKLGNSIGLTLPITSPFLKAIPLCKGSTICAAFCCNTTQATQVTAYSYADDLTSSTTLYSDVYGTIPLANGYYSDGTYVAIVSNGAIVSYGDTADCVCTPPTLYEHTVCYGDTNCDAFCCVNGTISVWTNSPDFDSSLQIYLDAAGTMPANGWYNKASSATSINAENGVVWFMALTNNCDCDPTIVYDHNVFYKSTLESGICDICCGGDPVTVFTESTNFALADHLWINNVPLTDAPAGYYRDPITGEVLIVDANGDVTAINNCSSCECLYYYVAENCEAQILQNFSYPTPLALGTVVKSSFFTGQCWTIIGLTDNGYPIDEIFYNCQSCLGDTCNCREWGVSLSEPGTIQYLDCNSNVAYLDVNGESSYVICACEGSIIALTAGKLTINDLGPCEPGKDLNPFEAYYIGVVETQCDACCADGTIGTYYGTGTSFETSLDIYLNADGTLIAPNGYYKDLDGNTYYVNNGTIQYALNCADCICEYHYIVEDCDQTIGQILNYPTTIPIGTVVYSNSTPDVCWVIVSITTTPGPYDIDTIFGTCNECKGLPCECIQYSVSAPQGGSISYVNCETNEVNYMDLNPELAYAICACSGSIIAIAGNVNVATIGPCPSETYYPINALYIGPLDTSFCVACCDQTGTTVTVYGNGTTLSNSTFVYADINAAAVATPGYYRDLEGNFYTVADGGYISASSCADCPPCADPYKILFGGNGIRTLDSDTGAQLNTFYGSNPNEILVEQVDGKIVAVRSMQRYNFDATIDGTFDNTNIANGVIYGATKIGGNYYFAGAFTTSKGNTVNKIAAVNNAGAYVNMTSRGTGFGAAVNQVSLTGYNGSLYVYRNTTGSTTYNGTPCQNLLKMNTNGLITQQYSIGTSNVSIGTKPVWDSLGNMYVIIGGSSGTIVKFSPTGVELGVVTLGTVAIRGIVIDSLDRIYVCASGLITVGGTPTNKSMVRLNTSLVYDATFGLPTKNWRTMFLENDTTMYAAYVATGETVARVNKIDLATQFIDAAFVSPAAGTYLDTHQLNGFTNV